MKLEFSSCIPHEIVLQMKQMPTVREPVTASMVCHVTVHLPCQHVCALRLQPVSLQSKYIVSTRTKISVGSLVYRDYNKLRN